MWTVYFVAQGLVSVMLAAIYQAVPMRLPVPFLLPDIYKDNITTHTVHLIPNKTIMVTVRPVGGLREATGRDVEVHIHWLHPPPHQHKTSSADSELLVRGKRGTHYTPCSAQQAAHYSHTGPTQPITLHLAFVDNVTRYDCILVVHRPLSAVTPVVSDGERLSPSLHPHPSHHPDFLFLLNTSALRYDSSGPSWVPAINLRLQFQSLDGASRQHVTVGNGSHIGERVSLSRKDNVHGTVETHSGAKSTEASASGEQAVDRAAVLKPDISAAIVSRDVQPSSSAPATKLPAHHVSRNMASLHKHSDTAPSDDDRVTWMKSAPHGEALDLQLAGEVPAGEQASQRRLANTSSLMAMAASATSAFLLALACIGAFALIELYRRSKLSPSVAPYQAQPRSHL